MNIKCPGQNYCEINVVTDMVAQSCLWDLDSYLKHGFKKSNLIPVKKMVMTKRQQNKITGAIFMELMAKKYKVNFIQKKKWFISAYVLTSFFFQEMPA